MEKIRIALADDHQLFRNGLKILLGGYTEFEVVAEASNGAELLKMLGECPADIILMDISMPEMDGVEATARITRQHTASTVYVATAEGRPVAADDALHAEVFVESNLPPLVFDHARILRDYFAFKRTGKRPVL